MASITTDNSLSPSSVITFSGGGQLDISNRPQSIGGLSGTGTIYSFTGDGGSGGVLTTAVASGASHTFAGTLGGGLPGFAFIKAGAGTQTLSGSNNYTGTTTVSAGKLVINGDQSAATGDVTVAAGAALGGSGIVGGDTTIAGLHSPGNSPGVQTFVGDLVYSAGASVLWELAANTTSNSPVVFDQIVVGGNLAFDAATELALSFDSTGSLVNWTDAFWASDRSWTVYDVAGSTGSFDNLSISGTNWSDGLGNLLTSARPGASFSLSQEGADVVLTYSAVPEPSTLALVACGGALLAAGRLRRRCVFLGFLLAVTATVWASGPHADAADLYRSVLAGSANTLSNINSWSTTAVATGAAPESVTESDRLVFSNYWTPSLSAAAPSMWLNVANTQSVTVASGAVSAITDLTGNGRNASQATPANRPAYVSGSMNGLQVARFDGTSDVLDLVTFAQQSGQNIYAVVDTTRLQNDANRIFMNRTGGANTANAPGLYLAGPTAYRPATFWTAGITGALPNSAAPGWVSMSPAAAQAPNIFLWSFNLSGQDAIANTIVTGGPTVTTNFNSSAAVLTEWSSISNAAGSQWSAMDLGEVVVYSPGLTADDVAKTEAYFSAKWGIPLAGSSTNPYKNTILRADNTTYLDGSRQVAGLVFSGTGTSTALLGGTSGNPTTESLTLGADGIAVNAGVNVTTLGTTGSGGVNLVVAFDQSWTNESASLLRAHNGISRAAGDTTSRLLTIDGSGTTQLDGAIDNGGAAGSLALTKAGAGLLTLTGMSSYTGATTVVGGRLSVNGSLGETVVTVLAGGEFGGSGAIAGPVSVAAGGTLSPGNSIASLATGTTSFASASTFAFEYDSTAPLAVGEAADLLVVRGDLSIASGALINFADLASASNPFVNFTTSFAIINYSGSWNDGLFTYEGSPLADGSRFFVGGQQWEIDYNRTSAAGLDNFTADYLPSSSFVAITAVPEPSTVVLVACGGALLVVGGRLIKQHLFCISPGCASPW